MSEVISFRLNKDNPREAQALELLKAWCSKGYSVLYIITEALLKLNDPGPESMANNTAQELNAVLDQINKLLEQIETGGFSPVLRHADHPAKSGLNDNFLTSIKMTVKLGLKLDCLDISLIMGRSF